MLKTELLELIRNGENSGLDFKRDTIDSKKFAKEVVALVNHRGGSILLGIEDSGEISGLTRADIEEWVMNSCRDNIRPEIIPFFEIIKDVEPGKDVAVVTVDPGYAVHCLTSGSKRSYYVRVGTTVREPSPEELERLFQRRGNFRVELRPLSGTSLSDLDLHRLRDYFGRVREQDVPESDEEWQRLLVNTEFATQDDNGFSCVMAAILLFGKNPKRFLPQAGIEAVAYPGTEKDYDAKERVSLRAPLVGAWSKGESGRIDITDFGLIEQAMAFIKRNIMVTTVLENGSTRLERWQYPEEALREAIVNAVVHRDYVLSATDIELAIYSDRIEVVSPGQLPNGITPERMRAGCRAARNPFLKDIMRDYGYLEHMGMGIPRKIVRLMLEQNHAQPKFETNDESLTLVLPKGPVVEEAVVFLDEDVSEDQAGIMRVRCVEVHMEGGHVEQRADLIDNTEYHSKDDLMYDVARRLDIEAALVRIE